MNDWQSSLQQFLNNNPDLPEGAEAPAPKEEKKRLPRLDIMLDRKGRAGKTATIIYGFDPDMPDDEIQAVASTLHKRLGTGGSCRGGEILIQGDRRTEVSAILKTLGYPSRLI